MLPKESRKPRRKPVLHKKTRFGLKETGNSFHFTKNYRTTGIDASKPGSRPTRETLRCTQPKKEALLLDKRPIAGSDD